MLRNLPLSWTMVMQKSHNFAIVYYNNITLYSYHMTSGPGPSITAKIGNICNAVDWASCPTIGARCPVGCASCPNGNKLSSCICRSFHVKSTRISQTTTILFIDDILRNMMLLIFFCKILSQKLTKIDFLNFISRQPFYHIVLIASSWNVITWIELYGWNLLYKCNFLCAIGGLVYCCKSLTLWY